MLFISFGSPTWLGTLENAPNFLCAYAAWPVSKKTAAARLGEIECPRRLPSGSDRTGTPPRHSFYPFMSIRAPHHEVFQFKRERIRVDAGVRTG